MLGNVFGTTAEGAGQVVGVFDTQAFDEHLQRMGQLVDVDSFEVAQFHGDFLVEDGLTLQWLNIRAGRNRLQARQERWVSAMWCVGNLDRNLGKTVKDSPRPLVLP
ncbi:hypothetical protein M2D63_000980 [Pseudomonas sp. BJa5]|uniref:hypothetical protein n=1 Tax=Pseudomonas sp. BJa5 TaxID=2936270 RepID=UPI00385E8A01